MKRRKKSSRRRRSPAQIAAFKKMRAALNRKRSGRTRTRRPARRRRRSYAARTGVPPMPRRSRRRRSSRRSSRRARTRRGFSLSFGGVTPKVLAGVALTTGGFAGVNLLLDKLSISNTPGKAPILPASLATGVPRIATKAVIGIGAAMIARKMRAPSIARGLLYGSLVSVTLDVMALVMNKVAAPAGGVHGMGDMGDVPDQLGQDGRYDLGQDQRYLSGDMGAWGQGDKQLQFDAAAV